MKFEIILADPPWSFKTYSDKGKGKSPEQHYNCMTLEDIKNLPIKEIAADNCILFLWTTFPLLEKSFEVIDKWGFTYKTTSFVWIKTNKKAKDTLFWGCGYWSRSNAEICLLATLGNPKRVSKKVHQVIMSPVEAHSKKPDIIRDKIVELCGDKSRVELFSRQKIDGWVSLGNEIDGKDIRDSLQDIIKDQTNAGAGLTPESRGDSGVTGSVSSSSSPL